MTWVIVFLMVIGSSALAGTSSKVPPEFAQSGLTEGFALSRKKLIQEVRYSVDLSKVVFVGRKSDLASDLKAEDSRELGDWRLTVSAKKDVVLFSKGLRQNELEVLLSSYGQTSKDLWIKQIIGADARAELSAEADSCQCSTTQTTQSKTDKAPALDVKEILSRVSVTQALRDCDFDVKEMLQKAIQSAVDTYTNLDLLSLTKLSKVWDTIVYAMNGLTVDLSKTLSKLGERAPKMVEGLICNVLKQHGSSLVMAAVLPGGAKRIPFEIEKIVERLAEFANAPLILNLIERGAFNPSFLKFEKSLSQLTESIPRSFRTMQISDKNLALHYEKHRHEFEDVSSFVDYQKKMLDFSRASGPNIVHLCPPKKPCTKLNVETGEYLALAPNGFFTSYFKMGGNPEERMKRMLSRYENAGPLKE